MSRLASVARRVIVPKGWGGLILRELVVIVLVAAIVAPIEWNASVEHARQTASDALDIVPAAMGQARLAADENTWEGDQFAKAEAAYDKALASYESGSFFNRGDYERARSYAERSLVLSFSVINRVSKSLAAARDSAYATAEEGGYQAAIDQLFGFCTRYPRTEQARYASKEAVAILFGYVLESPYDDAIDRLKAIAYFLEHYPLDSVPVKVTAKARKDLLELARAQYQDLRRVTTTARSWVRAMRSQGQTNAVNLTVDESEIAATRKLLPALDQPPAMRQLLVLLGNGRSCWTKIEAIYKRPVSVTSTARIYSSYQVSSIDSLADRIAADLSLAKRLLATL